MDYIQQRRLVYITESINSSRKRQLKYYVQVASIHKIDIKDSFSLLNYFKTYYKRYGYSSKMSYNSDKITYILPRNNYYKLRPKT